jgi:hypothetical protein
MNDLRLFYLAMPPEHIAYVKFIFESYEEVGIIRTVDRAKAVVVLLAMRDFVDTAREILASIKKDIPLEEIPPPANMPEDWLMSALAAEVS